MTVPELSTDLVVHRYGRRDDGAPTMLLLHGLTDSGRCWPGAVRNWEDRFAIVAVDQRGHGGSPRFTSEQLAAHPGEVMVEDATSLLEQLDRPVVVGHSLGGAVALTAAVRRPELVRAIVLEDPAPLDEDEPQQRPERGEEFVAGVRESLEAGDDETLFESRKRRHPDWPEEELLVTGQAEQQTDLDYLQRADIKPVTRWPELFAQVSVPTLVVSGDRADEICVHDEMERGLGRIANPHVTLTRIGSAGHCVRRERPAEFYAAVDRWLEQLDQT